MYRNSIVGIVLKYSTQLKLDLYKNDIMSLVKQSLGLLMSHWHVSRLFDKPWLVFMGIANHLGNLKLHVIVKIVIEWQSRYCV